MNGQEVRRRLEQLVMDFEARAGKRDSTVPAETMGVVKALLQAARDAVPDDPIVQAVRVPSGATYGDLIPTLRQVSLALPMSLMVG